MPINELSKQPINKTNMYPTSKSINQPIKD